MQWVVKSDLGRFENQPNGFKPLYAIENRFFICECPVEPMGDFVVEYPEKFYNSREIYMWHDGQVVVRQVEDSRILLSNQTIGKKQLRALIYTPEIRALRSELIKWIALNVFLPDKQRMLNIGQDEVENVAKEIKSFANDRDLKDYVKENLYYNC